MANYCYDGYGIRKELLNNQKALEDLRDVIMKQYFPEEFVKQQIIAVNHFTYPNVAKQNEGLSLVILGDGKHFTCHTYPQRGIVFADLCLPAGEVAHNFHAQLQVVFRAESFDDCMRNSRPGKYGKHVVMRFDCCWRLSEALQIVENIRVTLEMSKLGDTLVRAHAEDFDILQPIVESHIALHVDETKRQMTLDIFSCRDFEEEIIRGTLQPVTMQLVQRGVDFEKEGNNGKHGNGARE